MSKSSKLASKELHKKEKAAKKAREQAKYLAFKEAGTNSKSKRNVLSSRRGRKSATKHLHLIGNCGNVGCNSCFPRLSHFQMRMASVTPHVSLQ